MLLFVNAKCVVSRGKYLLRILKQEERREMEPYFTATEISAFEVRDDKGHFPEMGKVAFFETFFQDYTQRVGNMLFKIRKMLRSPSEPDSTLVS